MLDALAVDRANLLVVENLEGLYGYLQWLGPDESPYSREELEGRLSTVQRVEDYLRLRPPGAP